MSDDAKKPDEKKAPAAAEQTPPTTVAPATAPATAPASGAKLKPEPLTLEQITAQVLAYRTQKEQNTQSLKQLNAQLAKIQGAIKENEEIRSKLNQLMSESYSHFAEEWKRKSEFYPEIRLQMLLKAVEALTPKK